MDRAAEKRLMARAVELGNAGAPESLEELVELSGSTSAQVRRLSVSAIGKIAEHADPAGAVMALQKRLRDAHPQVRQYAAKALLAYGTHAACALHDLDDMAACPAETDYNQRDAAKAAIAIREAVRIEEEQAVRLCQRCGRRVSAGEFSRSQKAFQRIFCDPCFDEVFLKRRRFDAEVELNKVIPTQGGAWVQSKGERLIADYLYAQGIAYRYDERFRIIEGFAIRPDFYLPEFDLYIEYWGMDTADYRIGMLMKQKLYQQEGKRLISVYPQDWPKLAEVLAAKLARHMRVEPDSKPPAP